MHIIPYLKKGLFLHISCATIRDPSKDYVPSPYLHYCIEKGPSVNALVYMTGPGHLEAVRLQLNIIFLFGREHAKLIRS